MPRATIFTPDPGDHLHGANLAGLIVGVLLLLAIATTCFIKVRLESNKCQRKSGRSSRRHTHCTKSNHPHRNKVHSSSSYDPQYIMTASEDDLWARWAEARRSRARHKKRKHRHHHTRKSRSGKLGPDIHGRQRRQQRYIIKQT